MVKAELRETRSPGETNWYSAIEVWSCASSIGVGATSLKIKIFEALSEPNSILLTICCHNI